MSIWSGILLDELSKMARWLKGQVMRKSFLSLSLSLVALVAWANAQATSVQEMNTQGLTQDSQWVHIGKVTSSWSSYDPDRGMIFTYVKLRVDETLKGSKQSEVLIRQPGGQSNGYGQVVHGMMRFKKGERALVFLKQDRDGAPTLTGITQGKYRIYKSLQNGEEMALYQVPKEHEFARKNAYGKVERHHVHSSESRRVPLSQLVEEIRDSVTDRGGEL